jgi:uncharacterized protein (TIGR02266 family)
MEEQDDTRVGRRRTLFVQVQIREEDAVFAYKARNVSIGGVFVEAQNPQPVGTALRLSFRLPPHGPDIACEGIVRWNTLGAGAAVRHPGMGVGFVKLDAAAVEALAVYIERETGEFPALGDG